MTSYGGHVHALTSTRSGAKRSPRNGRTSAMRSLEPPGKGTGHPGAGGRAPRTDRTFALGRGAPVRPRTVQLARRPGATRTASVARRADDAEVYQSPPEPSARRVQDDWGAIARLYD